jgi:hypothetical protein
MTVYIVIGEIEGVYQDEIGGPFVSHPRKEIIKVFANQQAAEYFVDNCKLSKPKKERYGDTSYYKFGYCTMEIESHEVT